MLLFIAISSMFSYTLSLLGGLKDILRLCLLPVVNVHCDLKKQNKTVYSDEILAK